ncbi:MAG: GNAT family N-acetyltransferase [Chloroflexi bacterium]|nr:GNAT family N-acetyltransferase [Chloroflexota bacterium]
MSEASARPRARVPRSTGGWTVRETRDREEILAVLNQDRVYAAYAIGDLEPSLFAQCEWALAEHADGTRALALLFKGLEPHTLLLYGDPRGHAVILAGVMRPPKVYAIFTEEQEPALRARYALAEVQRMVRMVWDRTAPLPPPSPLTFRLTGARQAELQSLYRLYAEARFSPYQLMDGIFYGVERDGRLVAVAGTHLVSETYGVAAIGNVFTHPDYRGRGYALACTAAVLRDLAARIPTIVLNVGAENETARRVYTKLGFARYCEFYEAMAYRKRA